MLTEKLLVLALVGTEWIIWLLLILSIFSLAVILERLLVLRIKRGNLDNLKQKIGLAVRKGNTDQVEAILRDDSSSAAKISFQTIQNMKGVALDFDDSLSIAVSEEKLDLDRRIAILGTLGSNAPFIGLFGTVLGIIHAFHSLAQNTKGGPGAVMSGISEALVATALGLFVAIPAVAAYNYFVRYIKKIIVSSENFARLAAAAYIDASKHKR
ncbi:MAG: MotA/TolQ/ExbB proton channel family protein [Candidatus Omnitrophota bacterium]|nr:MotA/TolQ/ExbB proton channel family protein [Candidatus Omnitrophota bacterium]